MGLFLRCCGAKWKRMSLRERQPYMEESERLKQLHARQYPTYKVTHLKSNSFLFFVKFSINHVNEARPVKHRMVRVHQHLQRLHHHLHHLRQQQC